MTAIKDQVAVNINTTTKIALKAITDSLRNELNIEGIRALSVYAGRTATVVQEAVYRIDEKENKFQLLIQPEDIASAITNALNMPRSAEVTDIILRPYLKT